MSETAKTSVFIVLALFTVTLAIFLRPQVAEMQASDMRGKILFPKFVGPSEVKTLEIIAPSRGLADLREFRLTEVGDFWTIPSHNNYPADAKERMAQVVESLVDLQVLDVVAEAETAANVNDIHAACGVIDPQGEAAAMGEGVGTHLTITGRGGETLVDLLIGNKVDVDDNADDNTENSFAFSSASDKNLLRYVRIANQRSVYIVALDAARFSADFGDWIEKNLLDLNTHDVKRFFIDEYSMEAVDAISQGRIVRRISPQLLGDITFAHQPLAAENSPKWQLERMMSFRGKEYEYFADAPREDEELNGELLDAMLQALGELKIVDVAPKPESLAAALRDAKPLAELAEEVSLEKYGFLVAKMPNPKNSMQPEVRMLSKEGDFTISLNDGTQYVLRFGEVSGIDAGEISASGTETNTAEKKIGVNRYLLVTAQWDETSLPNPIPEPLPELPEFSENSENTEESDEAARATHAQIQSERERIEKRNQREQDDYDTKRVAAATRVQKLNARFAPWFYVISEEIYQKIHLDRTKLFRPKTAVVLENTTETPPSVIDPDLIIPQFSP